MIVSNGFNSIDYGAKTSAVVRLTIVPDHTRPTVTITSPLANARTNNPNMPFAYGTATDNAQVTNVMYWFTNINAGLSQVTNVQFGYATLSTNGNTNLNSLQHNNALVHHQSTVAGHEYPGRAKRGLFQQCFNPSHPALFLPGTVQLEPDDQRE